MQKSYDCDVATHIGPESCGAARKGGVEALTGERAGRVIQPRKNLTPGCRRRQEKRKAPSCVPISRGTQESRAVRDRDPRARLGDGRKPEQDTIAPAYHRAKCRAGAGQLCQVWLRPVANIDTNQRT